VSVQKFIARNSLMVAVLLVGSTILGFFRESSIAYMFGASGTTDAYLIALIIPTFFSGAISSSMTSTFVAVFTSYLAQEKKEDAWRMTNTVLSFGILLLGGILLLSIVFTTPLVKLVAPSYTGGKLLLTVNLMRILLPGLFFGGLIGVLVGINNSLHSFLAPSSIGLVSNVLVILSIFTLGRVWGVYGLATGVTLGVFFQFLLQLPSVRKHGFRYRFELDFKHPGAREVGLLIAPFILSAAAGQVNVIVDRILATGLPTGVVSALYFANKLVFMPYSMFTGAVGTVILPLLASAATLQDWSKLVEGINRGIRLLTIVVFPAAIGIYVLRIPLVQLLFQHGVFTQEDTLATANTIPYFLGALLFGAMVAVLVNIYFATKNMKFAVLTSIVTVIVNIVLSIILVRYTQQRGLALANSLSALVNLVLLVGGMFWVLKLHRKTQLPYRSLIIFLGQVGLAGTAMGAAVFSFNHLLAGYMKGLEGLVINTVASILVGCIVYTFIGFALKIEEIQKGLHSGISFIRSKVIKRPDNLS
jgi:putative peptidoglycan lipid II flippase